MELEVAFRLTILKPPAGVAFCLRAKDDGVVDRLVGTGDDLSFDFTMPVRRIREGGPPRLVGRFAFGPPAARFVYIGSGTFAGQPESCWSRRAKISLSGITWRLIDRALDGRARLEACVAGRAVDGGPLCAAVPLLGEGWRVGKAPPSNAN